MRLRGPLILSLAKTTFAWSFTGHELIAHIASDLLSPRAAHGIHHILGGAHLSTIAAWADTITWQPHYRYSSQLHYINMPEDDPPNDCTFSWHAPGGQEVIAAIHNYTQILKHAEEGTWAQSEALRFLVHFLEDMHQPLHLSGRARGGNDVYVHFDGYKTNLHKVWDGLGLMKRMRAVFYEHDSNRTVVPSDAIEPQEESLHELMTSYHAYILDLLETSHYQQQQKTWLMCPHSSIDPKYGCPEIWARDVAPLNCQYVWKDVVEDGTLAREYWTRIEEGHIIEELVMKAAVRLAAVLNSVFAYRKHEEHDGL